MKSFILYTYNDEKNIENRLKKTMEAMQVNDELIIIDDRSTDDTVPTIVTLIGAYFLDEERFKFHINVKHEGKTKSINKIKKIASNWHKEVV